LAVEAWEEEIIGALELNCDAYDNDIGPQMMHAVATGAFCFAVSGFDLGLYDFRGFQLYQKRHSGERCMQ
jgi:hypothetical protein